MSQNINGINASSDAFYLLNERLKNSIKTLGEVENLLRDIEANLQYSNECNDALMQENWQLKLSCEAWMKRAIQLEFKVLNARNAAEK